MLGRWPEVTARSLVQSALITTVVAVSCSSFFFPSPFLPLLLYHEPPLERPRNKDNPEDHAAGSKVSLPEKGHAISAAELPEQCGYARTEMRASLMR